MKSKDLSGWGRMNSQASVVFAQYLWRLITSFVMTLVFFGTVMVSGCATPRGVPPDDKIDNMLLRYQSGMRAYSQDDLETAEREFKAIIKRVPHDDQAWFRLANVYARTNRPHLAVQAYEEALVRNQNLIKAWHNMGIVQLRQVANTFASLSKLVPPSDPIYPYALEMAEAIVGLLGGIPEQKKDAAQGVLTPQANVRGGKTGDDGTDTRVEANPVGAE